VSILRAMELQPSRYSDWRKEMTVDVGWLQGLWLRGHYTSGNRSCKVETVIQHDSRQPDFMTVVSAVGTG
jgi:hypothetical protein